MPQYESSPEHEPALRGSLHESLGVLVVNLGTPDEPTPAAVRRYLKQFLSDPRVVELPRWLWWPVLHGFILRVRPARSAAAYRKIWTDDGSPLLKLSNDLAEAMQEKLSAKFSASPSGSVAVRLGMSYGSPSIDSALQQLHQQGVRRIVVLPLYPQYSGSTTGSVFDSVTRALARRRWVPEMRFINQYYDNPGYVAALAASVREAWDTNGRGERLLFSFHGIPRRMVEKGDPYQRQCLETARRVAEALELGADEWQLSFQSRLGRAEWLKPYTDVTLQQWGEERMGRIDVVCPGFAVDCLETLEEIAMRYAERYVSAGGGELRYIPALNARDDHASFLCRLVERHATGYTEASTNDTQSNTPRAVDPGRSRDVSAAR
ncbi:MAG TPA: ferrochelatase [Woeseiaceae bacterium]|nr:ferrochelatase [Woeseiaceae bacterium]